MELYDEFRSRHEWKYEEEKVISTISTYHATFCKACVVQNKKKITFKFEDFLILLRRV